MSRRTLLVRLAGAAVGIVAIAFAAATIDNPIEPGGDGGIGGEGEGSGTQPTEGPVEEPISSVEVPAFLEYLVLLALVIVAVLLAWYLINHRRRAVKLIATVLLVVLVALAAVYGISALDPEFGEPEPPDRNPAGEENESPGDPGTGEGDATVDTNPISSVLLAIGAVAAIFIGALALSRRDTDSPAPEGTVDDEDDQEEAAAVGAAAGRAAERIEAGGGEDIDNEVYRAWQEMIRLLEVERPETSTPGEFADAAIEAGIDREDVTDLTRLFEDVRYGHRETTEVEERRAVGILRRIESEYGGEEE